MATDSKLPSGENLSKPMQAYHQSIESQLKSLQTTLNSGVVSTIDSTSGAFTLGYGLSRSSQALSASLSYLTGSLGADVPLNNTANYFDGPSVAQGTTGTWLVTGTVTFLDTAAAAHFECKLWDGTTVIASARITTQAINAYGAIALSGIIVGPAGDLRLSVRDATSTNGVMKFNITGNSKDSHITAVRIA